MTVDESGIPMPDFRKVTRKQFAAIGEVTFEDIETGQRTGKRVISRMGWPFLSQFEQAYFLGHELCPWHVSGLWHHASPTLFS